MFDPVYLWAIIPLVIINLSLVLYCLSDWLKRSDFRPPGKWGWLAIFACFQYIGPIIYIVLVKNHDNH